MKIYIIAIAALGLVVTKADASTTINVVNRYACGANVGWMDAHGDITHGAVIGQYVCSGYIYAANVGWIHLGDGTPSNGIQYQNNSGTDCGVNHNGTGKLRGYGYGANIGWINFESIGNPKVNLTTGDLSGYAWSANCGWISLNNAYAFVQTDILFPGTDLDKDGIADAWEYEHVGKLVPFTATSDSDGDGVLDVDEYGADTDPLNPGDFLAITDFQAETTTNWVTWPVKATRIYTLQHTVALSNGMSWSMTSTPFLPPTDTDVYEEISGVLDSNRFYRVQAILPLSP